MFLKYLNNILLNTVNAAVNRYNYNIMEYQSCHPIEMGIVNGWVIIQENSFLLCWGVSKLIGAR